MYLKLIKGLAIYRQNHTKSIYVRLRVDGKEIRRSLGTSDVEEATSKAWALKFEMEGMVKAGLEIVPVQRHTIEKACNAVILQLKNKKPFRETYNDYIYLFNSFIIPFFKNKSIQDLTTKNIRLYFESLDLSETRRTMNKTCFSHLFHYLEEEDLLKKRDFPSFPKDIKAVKKQIGFDFLESDLKAIRDFITSDDWINQKNINFKTREYRLIFPHVFTFLLETGMRTGEEMNNIRYSDLIKYEKTLYVKIRKGKTKEHKQREVVLSNKAIDSLIAITEITKGLTLNSEQLLKTKDCFIFESSFNKICDFCKLFDQIIKKLIENNIVKKKYTLYCCRHTYITKQLLNSVDMLVIAKQVGNSLETIQRHYDHSMLKDNKNVRALIKGKSPVRF
ncbi:tyrosine-type recombinase/integrase [Vibrio parahaemolyticus]|nr:MULTISPECIES: site-specific integrase [Vibrio harveyi group]ELL4668382.1 site-specific integrase [Vibrio fluvialis]GHZ23595.1 integrase [Vibrio cholerae]EJE4209780.1 site-specific integrase [Vibrio parahaemolyticus]EJG1090547.1 site-specific integrase [Vibrio parahaemolyticus]MBT0045927.1 site-specific integrase [Vibrio alginolyticus]